MVSLTIAAPSTKPLNSKMGTLEKQLPTDRKICYAVSVSGPGIEKSAANPCSPELSMTAGFVEPGKLIEVLVPKGDGRRIELYMFLQKVGENTSCPFMASPLPPVLLKQTYLLGKVEGVSLQKDSEEIEVPFSFSGLDQNIVQTLNLPQSCLPIQDPIAGENGKRFGIYTGAQKSSGGGYKLYGIVGKPTESKTASGGGFRIIAK